VKRWIGIGLLGVFLMATTLVPIRGATEYDYTLLIYMNGSDLESEYEAATDDLLEMIAGTLSDDVAVIIETGGTSQWYTENYGLPPISNSQNQLWRMTDSSMEYLGTVGRQNMGATDTLVDFLDYGMTNFPSDQYGLVMWNHGAGAIYGYGADELYNYDTLTLEEFQTALETNYAAHGNQFDLVGFDACLMASIETAQVLAPYAKFMVGSEELEPGHGWSYAEIMSYISAYDNPEPDKLGKAIINAFKNQSEAMGTSEAITLSLVDLSKTQDVLTAMDALLTRVSEDLTKPAIREDLLKARLDSESYGEGNGGSEIPDSDMVDIIDYATNLNEFYPYQAESLVLAVQDAVLTYVNSPYKPAASGLSMYVPALDKETMVTAPLAMADIGMSQVHVTFLDTVTTILNGAHEAIDFEEQITTVTEGNNLQLNLDDSVIEGDDRYYYFNVAVEDLAGISEISTVMGKVDTSGDIQYLALEHVYDMAVMEDGAIIGETLRSWVTINGVTVAMYYESHSDKGIQNYYIPISLNGDDADLIVLFSDVYPDGKILGARKLNTGNENVYNRSLIALKPEDVIEFVYQYDHYDILRGSYSYDGWYVVDAIQVGEGLSLEWRDLNSGEYAYAFVITDIYGYSYQTDWIIYEQTDIEAPLNSNEPQGGLGEEGFAYPWLGDDQDQPSDWAIPHVTTAYNNNLTTDRTLINFTEDISREAFCELVVKLYENATGRPIAVANPEVFIDTDNIAVAKAYELGIVGGYGDGRFGPDDLITRQQLMAMFFRTLVRLDPQYGTYSYPELEFSDAGSLDEWAVEPAKSLVSFELIDGVGDNRLAPQDNATIEQSLKLVNGVYEFYLSQSQ